MTLLTWADFVNLEGCTRFRTNGMWKGQEEDGLVIEIMGNEKQQITEYMCELLAWKLKQEKIMVEGPEPIQLRFIGPPSMKGEMEIKRGEEVYRVKYQNIEAELEAVKKQLEDRDYTIKDLNPGDDVACTGCGSVTEYNQAWEDLYGMPPFKCLVCGGTEYTDAKESDEIQKNVSIEVLQRIAEKHGYELVKV
ncbi:MAG: hypothetical protein ABSD99_07250 [Candidatus Bathyarchaeia archaeon]